MTNPLNSRSHPPLVTQSIVKQLSPLVGDRVDSKNRLKYDSRSTEQKLCSVCLFYKVLNKKRICRKTIDEKVEIKEFDFLT